MKASPPFVTVLALSVLLTAAPAVADWDAGVAAFQGARYEEAVAEFQDFVKQSPEAAEARYMLGLSLAYERQPQAAVAELARAVELDSDNFRYRLALVQTQLTAGRTDAAFDTLVAVDPATVPEEARQVYGQLLSTAAAQSARPAEVVATLERLLAGLGPQAPSAKPLWQAVAQAAQKLQRPEKVFAAQAAAYRLDPRDAELGERAVRTAFSIADGDDEELKRRWYRQGAELARLVAERAPSARTFRLAGEAEMGSKSYDAARSWFERAAAADAKDPWPHYYLARCSLSAEDGRSALHHVEAALARSPDAELRPDVLAAKGKALWYLERYEEAALAYRASGDEEGAKKMDELVRAKQINDGIDDKCAQIRVDVAKLRRENEDLRGTPDWDRMEKEIAAALAGCAPAPSQSS